MQVLDYSAGYPGATAIARAGYAGTVRYLRKEGASRVQPITAAEYTDMRAHGLSTSLVYQAVDKARVLQGHAAGVHDAGWALGQARAVGIHTPRAIYFAVDFDVSMTQVQQILAYLDGAATVLGIGRVGVYGGYRIVSAAVPTHATYGWQTAAWSSGKRAPTAHLYQRIGTALVAGIGCDINDVLALDWGQDTYQEDDMFSEDDAKRLKAVHDRVFGMLNQRYYVTDPNGTIREVPEGTPNARPARALDTLDGNYLVATLGDDEQKIIAAIREYTAGDPTNDEITAKLAAVVRETLPASVVAALVQLAANDQPAPTANDQPQ